MVNSDIFRHLNIIFRLYILSTFKYCPLTWMFSGKTENNFINKIFKRTLQSIYETEDATFENLVERDESQSINKNENTHITN